ncbi:hypothetical protein BUALT_Bualt01G0153600 [Buddleja alternifolia]|uniref:VQ domain-containing protein n=1 Tax=Buddleja alternifolia TaxID=168488 RepID=A0AAV6YD82_9LAMI|nr:hypothetical protein BUALT_Bualt01G0153600 [Buddleja alternifolia]
MEFHHQSVSRLVKSHKKGHKGKRKNDNSLKVVYISSPMKVKTSASRFRSLVQQLTGKNSDVSRYIEADTNRASDFHEIDCEDDGMLAKEVSDHQGLSSISSEDTPTSSDSFLGPIDNVFNSQIEEQFAGIFSSGYSFCDPSQLDVLGSYDELL